MQELISVIYAEPILLRLALLLIGGCVMLLGLQGLEKKRTKWTPRTTEGTEQRLRARKIIIYENYE